MKRNESEEEEKMRWGGLGRKRGGCGRFFT